MTTIIIMPFNQVAKHDVLSLLQCTCTDQGIQFQKKCFYVHTPYMQLQLKCPHN